MIYHLRKPLKLLWYLLAILIITLAVFIQACRLIAPYINDFRGDIEHFISRQINAHVSIGALEASWYGLRPKVTVHNFYIESDQQKPMVDIHQGVMELDILPSLLNWTPVWRKVEFQGLDLMINQNAAGGWSVGRSSSVARNERTWRYRNPGALFLVAKTVDIRSASVTFVFNNQRQFITTVPSILIQNNGHFHRLKAQASVTEQESVFDFVLEGVGDPSDHEHFFAKAYLDLNGFPVERLVHLFGQMANTQEPVPSVISGAKVDMGLWFDFASPSRFLLDGHVNLLDGKSGDYPLLAMPFSANITGDYGINSGLTVGLRDIQTNDSIEGTAKNGDICPNTNKDTVESHLLQGVGDNSDAELTPPLDKNCVFSDTLDLGMASFNIRDGKLKVALERFDLAGVDALIDKPIAGLQKTQQILSQLSLNGYLKNIWVETDFLKRENTSVKAEVVNLSAKPWKGVPGFKNVTGYLESNLQQGFFLLNTDGFEIYPKKIYSQPLILNTTQGYIGWQLSDENIQILGQNLSADSLYGNANGHFLLNLSKVDIRENSDLILQIGLSESKAEYHRRLIPNILPDSFSQWLNSSIQAGDVHKGGFFYRGGFGGATEHVVQLFLDVENGRLDFDSNWPALDQLKGRIIVHNETAKGSIANGTIYGRNTFQGGFNWSRQLGNIAINLSGQRVAMTDGIQYIQESWLGTRVDGFIDQVSVDGEFDIDLLLEIPLDPSREGSQDITIQFQQSQFTLGDIDLSFDNINGELYYSTKKGLVSNHLSALLFENPLDILIAGGDQQASSSLMIKANGRSNVKSVADWLQRPALLQLAGEFDYIADLRIPLESDSDIEPRLSITTNLVGVSSAFPPPFQKTAEQALPLLLNVGFNDDYADYKLQLSSFLLSHYRRFNDESFRAAITINDVVDDVQALTPPVLPNKGIKVVAQLDQLQVDPWVSFLKNTGQQNGEKDKWDLDLLLSVNQLTMGQYDFKKLSFLGRQEQQGWSLIVDGDDIFGSIYLDNDNHPIVVDLDYLNWPSTPQPIPQPLTSDQLVSFDDRLATVEPSAFPAVDVTVNNLTYADKPLGNWYFELRPDDNGLDIQNIYAFVAGLSLSGLSPDQGAHLRWQGKSNSADMSTRFTGVIKGDSHHELLTQWQLPSIIDSKTVYIESDFTWPGSPLAFSVERAKGKLIGEYKEGIFLQEKLDGTTGLLKVLGVLNFDSWARRIRLDFSDVYKKGIFFNTLKGEMSFDSGMIHFKEPIIASGPSSKMSLVGSIDYVQETLDANLKVTLPIGGNLTLVTALAGGLPAAAGVYIVSKLFGEQVDSISSIDYAISGNLNDPLVVVEKTDDEAFLTEGESSNFESTTE